MKNCCNSNKKLQNIRTHVGSVMCEFKMPLEYEWACSISANDIT